MQPLAPESQRYRIYWPRPMALDGAGSAWLCGFCAGSSHKARAGAAAGLTAQIPVHFLDFMDSA